MGEIGAIGRKKVEAGEYLSGSTHLYNSKGKA
jgi:hypothetical protein